VKKIALTILAVSTLGLAACQGGGDDVHNNSAANGTEATENEANNDTLDASNAANSALNSDAANTLSNSASNVGDAIEEGVEDAGQALENATN
jgi:hypothetical protein